MEEGPTKGTTLKFLRWAIATTSAPGSATADILPQKSLPLSFLLQAASNIRKYLPVTYVY